MREDFVTRLQVQLRDAAEREARRGPVRRAARSWVGPAALVTALALLAGAVLAASGWLRGNENAPAGLRVLSITAPTSGPGQVVSGFGAVWLADPAGAVVRVDPRTGRVTDRYATGQSIRLVTAGAGSVWAMGPRGDVLRIDPASGRVVARFPLGAEDLGDLVISVGRLAAGAGNLWILFGPEMWRIDPARNLLEPRTVFVDGGPGPYSAVSDATALYMLRPDGILERRDARDGRRIASMPAALAGFAVAAGDGRVLLARDDGVGAVDAANGRALWDRSLRLARLNRALIAGRDVWVQGTPQDGGPDRLWRLDAASGRVLESLSLPEYGATDMTATGERVWITTPSGRLQTVGR